MTDSIKLDALQLIQDKCEAIEDRIRTIEANIRTFSSVDHLSTDLSQISGDFTLQHLRDRFKKLLSSKENCDLNVQRDMFTPSSANESNENLNLMNYQCIDELLTVPSSYNLNTPSVCNILDNDKSTAVGSKTATNMSGFKNPDESNCQSSNFQTQVGRTSNTRLEAASPPTDRLWFHVSNLKLGTSEELVKKFILENKNFSQMDIVVKSLINRNHDPSSITYASFKVGFEPSSAIDLTELKSIWPANVSFKEFIPKNLHYRRHRM